MVRRSLQWVLSLLIAAAVLWAPAEAMACIPGLKWGMDSSTVEQRLEVSLETARSLDEDSSAIYRVSDQHIGEIPVEQLDLRFGSQGLEQLVYSLPSNSMTEVLAGLRTRYGSPVSTTIKHTDQAPQQVWIWNTEDDCITAVRAEDQKFLLSYRPSRLRPSLL
ncbi:MAG: hypothetical protein HF560_03990 [Synechococcus sp. MIT S9220]|uniref:hypothetical protein n=1 Tax=unclassified Synechococcus TaxID=2626047 RepID=UPI00164AB280|nr:hypothetical protein [Synechococcus sp. MIT S9220]NOL46727.1 hypothetical protein [Synechococcus sp. MIT S9220]